MVHFFFRMLLCRDTVGRESPGSRYESTPVFGTSLVALSGWLFNWCINDAHVLLLRYAANIIGGLVFGVGFGLIGYCPGTGAAALGQGNWDAISGIAGLMIGSFLFAEASGSLEKTLMKVGDRGKLMLPEVVGLSLPTFLLIFLPLLIAVLFAIEQYAVR